MYSGVPLQILPLKISPVVGALNVVDEWLTAEKLSNNTIVMYIDSQFDLCCSLSLFSLFLSLSLSLSHPPSLPLSLSLHFLTLCIPGRWTFLVVTLLLLTNLSLL